MADLVDTNVLVYRFDPRFPEKQAIANDVLRRGIADGTARVPHQALLEFVAAVTKPLPGGGSLLDPSTARREAEELLHQVPVLYPNEHVFRAAVRGAAAYQLAWFDAHLWAYAEHYGLARILSEDFQHGRLYGSVQAFDPFAAAPKTPPKQPRKS